MSAPLGQLVVDLSLQSAAFQKGMSDATRAFERFERQGRNMNQSLGAISNALGGIKTAAAGAAAAFLSFSTLDKMVTAAEKVKTLKASFETLLGSANRAADMFERIKGIANSVGAPMDSVAEATQKLSIGLIEVGATNKQISGVVENFIKLGRVGGTSMADINGALVQFGQALASGRLQGDELRSIMERMPQLGKLLATEMGVSVGEIRKLGSEGKISAEIMANALLKATDNIGAQFALLPRTSEQAFNTMQNKATEVGAAIADAFNLTDIKIAGIDALTASLSNVRKIAEDAAAGIKTFKKYYEELPDGAKAVSLTVAITGLGAAVAALAISNPFTAFLTLAGAAAVGIIANWDKVTNFFTNFLPAALETVQAGFAVMAKGVIEIIKGLGEFVVSAFANMLNPVIRTMNSAGDLIGKSFNFQEIESGFTSLDTTIGSLNKTIEGSREAANRYMEAWNTQSEVVTKVKDSQTELFGSIQKTTEEQIKQAQVIKDGLDPAQAMAREMEKVANLQKAGLLTYQEMTEQMQKIREQYDETANAAGRSGAAQETLAEQLQKVLKSIDPTVKAAEELSNIMLVLDQSLAAGLLTWDQYAEAVAKAKDKINGQDSIKDSLDEIKDAVTGFSRQFVDGIVDAAFEGKLSFDKLLQDMAKSITKFMANKLIQQLFDGLSGGGKGGAGGFLSGLFGGLFGGGKAHGAAFNKGVEFFASGGIVNRATGFGMSGGRFGVMGEAGPEAIIPLKRSASGDLGVRASPVNVVINNNAPVDVAVKEKEDPNGMKTIELMIDRRVAKGIADGSFDKSLRGSFGLTRQGY